VEPGCYHAAGGFNLTCRQQGDPPSPGLFLGDGTVQVTDISVPSGTVRIKSRRMEFGQGPYSRGRITTGSVTWGGGLPEGGQFFLSESTGMVLVIGCNIQVDVHATDVGRYYRLVGSCTAVCPMLSGLNPYSSVLPYPYLPNGSCGGLGCCEANIILGYSFYRIQIQNRSISSSSYATSLRNAGIYIIDRDSSTYNIDTSSLRLDGGPPVTMDWVISGAQCPTTNKSAAECRSANSFCLDYVTHVGHRGYRCHCSYGYQGNPYVLGGCQGTYCIYGQ
jgi:hypothetical protein